MEKFNFQDRISNTPNRRKIKILKQTSNEILADIEMADEPSQVGTQIKAEYLTSWQNTIEQNETISNEAKTIAEQAQTDSNLAKEIANTAKTNAESSLEISDEAKEIANNAKATADDALQRAVDGLGTKIIINGEFVPTWDAETKVNRTDIIDNLTSDSSNNPLSAKQGKNLKTTTDALYQYYINLKSIVDATINTIYPIGSIYLSTINTSPASLFGGEWAELPNDKALWLISTTTLRTTETIEAGLPNIIGEVNCPANNDTDHQLGTCTGAFTGKSNSKNYSDNTNNTHSDAFAGFSFSAARQADGNNPNGIYGNSDTVQPPAYKVYGWKRIL